MEGTAESAESPHQEVSSAEAVTAPVVEPGVTAFLVLPMTTEAAVLEAVLEAAVEAAVEAVLQVVLEAAVEAVPCWR
jgi:hypothetical protein